MAKDIKWIENYEGLYSIEPNGEVFSHRARRYLKPTIDRYGYYKITLTKHGKSRTTTVHRLVAAAYVPNPYGKPCVNHKDENKTNNHYSNLEWTTVAENNSYGSRNQRISKTKCRKPVECIYPDGTIRRFDGVADASRKTGIAHGLIRGYCLGKPSSKYKIHWRYANA